MRFYTIEVDGKEYVAVENSDNKLVTLESMGLKVSDMNDLIVQFDSLRSDIDNRLKAAAPVVNYKILAPIPVPKQDIICLGVNYKEHIDETADLVDFTKSRMLYIFQSELIGVMTRMEGFLHMILWIAWIMKSNWV